VRTKAALILAALTLGLLGASQAKAEDVATICYEYHVNIADQVVQDSGPEDEPVCQTIATP
jgi:hypothetical protein